MKAVIQDGSQQFRVEEGSVVEIERVGLTPGDDYTFDVLAVIGEDDDTKLGSPHVDGASVVGEVLREKRGEKLIVYTFKRRKDYARKKGHRQNSTMVKITKISA